LKQYPSSVIQTNFRNTVKQISKVRGLAIQPYINPSIESELAGSQFAQRVLGAAFFSGQTKNLDFALYQVLSETLSVYRKVNPAARNCGDLQAASNTPEDDWRDRMPRITSG
jgi:hypothetical protein